MLNFIKSLKPSNSFEASFMLLLFALPTGLQLFVNISLGLLFLNSILFLRKSDYSQAIKNPVVGLSILFFSIYGLSILYAQNKDFGLQALGTKLSFLVLPLFIVAGGKSFNEHTRHKLAYAYLIGLLLTCTAALLVAANLALAEGAWFYDLNDGFGRRYYFTYTHLAKPIMHPGYFSTYLGFGVFTTIWLWPKFKAKVVPLALLLFLFGMMVLLQGRINLLALLLVVGLMSLGIALKRRAYKWLLAPVVPIVLLGAMLVFASAEFKERYFQAPDFSYDISGNHFNSATYRLAEWYCASRVIAQSPILGTGFGDHKEALYQSYENNKFLEGLKKRYNAHNQYLETTLATGLVGLMALLALLLAYTWQAKKQNNLLVLACLIFFALSMLTESMFERAWAILLFNAFLPLFLVSKNQVVD